MSTKFEIKKIEEENTGASLDSVVKIVDGKPDEVWCSIAELHNLFTACVTKWGDNWNMEKITVAVTESDIK